MRLPWKSNWKATSESELAPPASRATEPFRGTCGADRCAESRFHQWMSYLGAEGLRYEGKWYHSFDCVLQTLVPRIGQLLDSFRSDRQRAHRIPIGLLLVNRGAVTPGNLREALKRQRAAGQGKIGEWLKQVAPFDEEALTAALSQQWGCPVFPMSGRIEASLWGTQLPPLTLMRESRAAFAFAEIKAHRLHIAFAERVDRTLLYACERILGWEAVACIASETAIDLRLREIYEMESEKDLCFCFEPGDDAVQIARTIGNYAAQAGAETLTVTRAGQYLWAALEHKGRRRDLLFRVRSKESSSVSARESLANVNPLTVFADRDRGVLWSGVSSK